MLDFLGLNSMEELFSDIPGAIRVKGAMGIPNGLLNSRSSAG